MTTTYGVPSRIDGKPNPEYFKRWAAANPEKVREAQRRNYERKRTHGISTNDYRTMVVGLLLERDGPFCGICGDVLILSDAQIDHIQQRAIGGSHEPSNLRLVHGPCNRARPKPRSIDQTPDGIKDFIARWAARMAMERQRGVTR